MNVRTLASNGCSEDEKEFNCEVYLLFLLHKKTQTQVGQTAYRVSFCASLLLNKSPVGYLLSSIEWAFYELKNLEGKATL